MWHVLEGCFFFFFFFSSGHDHTRRWTITKNICIRVLSLSFFFHPSAKMSDCFLQDSSQSHGIGYLVHHLKTYFNQDRKQIAQRQRKTFLSLLRFDIDNSLVSSMHGAD